MKKTILLDVDEVVCFPSYLEAVNDFLGTDYVIDDFTAYYIEEEAIPKESFNLFTKFLKERNLYSNAVILPGAIETIKLLNEVYDIYICSACINPFDIENSGKLFFDKYNFLRKILPFIDPNRFIFTSSKHMFKGDIQIDDRLPNLQDSINTKILFTSYHNLNIEDAELKTRNVIRAGSHWSNGWSNVKDILIEKPKILIKK